MKPFSAPLLVVFALTPIQLAAQENPDLARAEQSWMDLDFEVVVSAARSFLETRPPSSSDRARAWELTAFAYHALGRNDSAVVAFQEVIRADPDREYDPDSYSPQLIALHTTALGQVLAVRHIEFDSTSFVAGQGTFNVPFEVTIPAEAQIRVIGPGIDAVVGVLDVTGNGVVEWDALDPNGAPLPEGSYTLVIAASAFRDEASRAVAFELRHGTLDTLPHVSEIGGARDTFPEVETPPRNWEPLLIGTAAAAVTTGAAFALESSSPDGFARRELIAIDVAALVTGLVWSLRTPAPRPVPANIAVNQVIRGLVRNENARRTQENVQRRQQVLVTIVPVRQPSP